LWTSEKDSGQSDALNRAFARASGDWIGLLNADEFYLPDALKTLVSVGEQEDADLVFADMALADERGRFLRLLPQHVLVPRILPIYAAIASCAMLIRRSVLVSPPWDAELHGVMDRDLYLRLRRGGARFVYCSTIAAAFRVHPAQKTVRHAEQFSREFTAVQQRYGYPSFWGVRLAGRAVQASCKLVSGAYARQFAASRFRYADLRWFASPSARTVVDELIQSTQRRRAAIPARAATTSKTTIE
jgi:glycosyltransferase involved in cell wall biosynthesis